jgi:hypothetical protein
LQRMLGNLSRENERWRIGRNYAGLETRILMNVC